MQHVLDVTLAMARLIDGYERSRIGTQLIHYTGSETPLGKIDVPSPIYRLLGSMLGSADIIAQMADRCYLEKCRDRLYPEFVAGVLATRRAPDSAKQVVFASGKDLVMKTPDFFRGATKRLDMDLGGCYSYAQQHFGGQNLYLEELNKNVSFAQAFSDEADTAMLKRKPPATLSP